MDFKDRMEKNTPREMGWLVLWPEMGWKLEKQWECKCVGERPAATLAHSLDKEVGTLIRQANHPTPVRQGWLLSVS
jgi:hypothetical protein